MRAGGADEDVALAQGIDDADGGVAVGLGGVWADEVDADVQAGAADGGDAGGGRGDGRECVEEITADGSGVVAQAFGLDHVEHRDRGGDADRVAAEGVEVPDLLPELRDDLRADGDAGDRHAVAHRLAHHDEVGHDAVALEAPDGTSGAGEARLDLIGDVEASGLVHGVDHGPQETGRAGQDPVGGEDAVGDERRELDPVPGHVGDRVRYPSGEGEADVVRGSWIRWGRPRLWPGYVRRRLLPARPHPAAREASPRPTGHR